MKRSLCAVLILSLVFLVGCAGSGGTGLFPQYTQEGGESSSSSSATQSIDEDSIRFTANDVYGNRISSADMFSSNKITMINIWASWCGPCVSELGELQTLSLKLKEINCGLIGILDDGDTASGLQSGLELIRSYGLTYTVIVPNSEVRSCFDYMYYPTSFFVDSSGHMIGEPIIGAQVDQYLPYIQQLLGEIGY